MAPLTFEDARSCVLAKVLGARRQPLDVERVPLLDACGRVLAEPIAADRDYPPVPRSARDGFAVRAADLPGALRIAGEVRAGESFQGRVERGTAVEIMTGAPVPEGADAVVMIEHCTVSGDTVSTDRSPSTGDNVSAQGSEARAGGMLLEPGQRIDYAGIALLAAVGRSQVSVFRRLRVAILATGDEIVPIEAHPAAHQIRNSNSYSIAAQVARAGAIPVILPVARDEVESTGELIGRGLQCDLMLVAGGVSAGKYDLVEKVLAQAGAGFYFDRVKIQPGQPLVFGSVQGKFFFGLPGNPGSTMLTFELFARAAIELLSGQNEANLPLTLSRLCHDFRQKPGLTRFLPALLSADGSHVSPIAWRGSSDVPSLARANAFLVTEPERETWNAGDLIRVLMK